MSDFIKVPRWVIADSRLTRSDRMVYMTLAYFASDNKDHVCNPSIKEIEALARYSDRNTIVDAIKHLEECDCIEVDRETGYPNIYYLPQES